MKTDNLKIRFIVYKSRINRSGKSPIYCRLTFKGQRRNFATGFFTIGKDWNSKRQSSSTDDKLNQRLKIVHHKLEEIELYLNFKKDEYDVESILALYFNKPIEEKGETVISFYNKFLNRQKDLIGKDIKQITWNKYFYIYNHLEEFLKSKSLAKLELKELKLNLLYDFEYFLKAKKGNKQITVNKTLQRFKKVIKQAQIEGFIDRDPFLGYKVKKINKQIVYLKQSELKKLEEHKFGNYRLEKVRDCFVLCCYTGLAYNEMSRLKSKHLQTNGGVNWIIIDRTKTEKTLEIPLLKKAENLISKYTFDKVLELPVVSNQRFNSYLKEIAEIVGIEKNLTHHVARKTFATTVLLENNIPIEIVSHVLGHSSIKVTQDHYGKILSSSVAKEFKSLNSKL
jgi:site-specific recombinase XerD